MIRVSGTQTVCTFKSRQDVHRLKGGLILALLGMILLAQNGYTRVGRIRSHGV